MTIELFRWTAAALMLAALVALHGARYRAQQRRAAEATAMGDEPVVFGWMVEPLREMPMPWVGVGTWSAALALDLARGLPSVAALDAAAVLWLLSVVVRRHEVR